MNHIKLMLLIASYLIPPILALCILLQKGKSLSKLVMIGVLLNSSFLFVFDYLYFVKAYRIYSCGLSLHIVSMLWLFPSLYLYIKSNVISLRAFRREIIHLLPGVVLGLISAAVCYGMLDQAERITYLIHVWDRAAFTQPAMHTMYVIRMTSIAVILVQMAFYYVAIRRITRCYEKQLLEEFSNIEQFSLIWIRKFTLGFMAVSLLCLLFYIFRPFPELHDLLFITFLCLLSVQIWVIGFLAFWQHKPARIFVSAVCHAPPAPPPASGKESLLAQKLLDHLVNQKAYLRQDLSLSSLSKELYTNRTALSNLINRQFGVNFNVFINRFRAEHARNHQKHHPKTTQEELAQVSGFGSVSSMRRAMGKREGG
jgi:Response regulator containing CheY-like receiver domain and AraC-type DNA-binding domain